MLGPLEVRAAGGPVRLGGPRQQTLLAVLAAAAGSAVPADALVDALWGSDPPRSARNSLQSHVSRLRSALADAGEPDRIEARGQGYALHLAPDELDAACFEVLLDRARGATPDPQAASDHLAQALACWRGPAFAGLDGEVLSGARVRLEELRLQAVEERFDAQLAAGRHGTAVPELEAAVAVHPLRERLWQLLVVGLYRQGRQVDAVRASERYRRLLADETGLEVGPAFAELADAVVRGTLDGHLTPARRQRRASPRRALPTPTTTFVGRHEERDAARRRLARARLLTVTGVGGAGKTRFALELARDAAVDHPGGTHLAELAPLRAGDAIGLALADLVGAGVAGGESAAAAVARSLGPEPTLLVLDNCEHLLDEVAPLAADLLATCPALTILATSRQRLAVDGEHVWPLAPLPDAEAVDLLAARARLHRPGFTLHSGNRDAVADVVRRLDGLPLALELAAARLATVTPAELAALLGDPLRVLGGGRRSGADRHRTLVEVLDWSWRLLDQPDQDALAELSLFAAPFTLAAAAAVTGREQVEAVLLLGRLVDASLVQVSEVGGVTRYRLLETVRCFASDRLAERGTAASAEERHTSWTIDRLAALRGGLKGPEERAAAEELDAELPDVRAVHQRLLDAGDGCRLAQLVAGLLETWVLHHAGAEPRRWLLAGAPVLAAAPGPHQQAALGVAAAAASLMGDQRRAAELGCLAVADGDPTFGVQLAVVALYDGRLAEAEARFRELVEHAGDAYLRAHHLGSLTMALAYQRRFEEARRAGVAAQEAAAQAGAPSVKAWAAYAMAEACAGSEPERAMAVLEDAVTWARQAGSEFALGLALHASASLAARHGEPDAALLRLAETLHLWHRTEAWTQVWTTVRNVAEALARLGVLDEAVLLAARADAAVEASRLYGEGDRQAGPMAAAEAALGPARTAELRREARLLDRAEAVERALEAIDLALGEERGAAPTG